MYVHLCFMWTFCVTGCVRGGSRRLQQVRCRSGEVRLRADGRDEHSNYTGLYDFPPDRF